MVFASLLLTMGALDDRIGRKRGLQIGLLIFGLGSLGSALSTTAGMLTWMRACMGIGGALIMPATLSIINASFPPQERARAIANWAAIFGMGSGIGPLAGGSLLKFFSWQSIFLVNLPVVAVALVGGRTFIAESRDPHAPAFDLHGVLLSIIGLFALVFAIISAGESGWTALPVLEAFGVAVIVLTLFVVWESRAANAMLPLYFFVNPSFSLANAAVVLLTFSFFGLIFTMSQYCQSVLGYEPLTVGVIQLPLVIVLMIVATQSARIAQRFGTKRTVAAGALLLAAALLYLALIVDVHTPYALIFISLVIFGAGFGRTTSTATNSVMQSVPVRKSGIGSAMNDKADGVQPRPAEGYELRPSIRLIEAPGQTPQDLTTRVGTPEAVVAFTHLWWSASRPLEDPSASDAEALHQNRGRVLSLAGLIVPGHGSPFRPDGSKPR